jgi:hypothetical protein
MAEIREKVDGGAAEGLGGAFFGEEGRDLGKEEGTG